MSTDPVFVGSHVILECDMTTVFGERSLRIQVSRGDEQPMSYREIWNVFEARYPGRWAIQAFPPKEFLLDEANKYHLFVFEQEPMGLNICRKAQRI